MQNDFNEKYTELQDQLDHSMKQALKLLEVQQESQKKTVCEQKDDAENFKIKANELLNKIEHLKQRVSSGERSAVVLVRLTSSIAIFPFTQQLVDSCCIAGACAPVC